MSRSMRERRPSWTPSLTRGPGPDIGSRTWSGDVPDPWTPGRQHLLRRHRLGVAARRVTRASDGPHRRCGETTGLDHRRMCYARAPLESSMPEADRSAAENTADDFDCQSCGACCVEAGAVILAEEDDVPVSLVQHVANLRCMVTEGTSFRCAALLGTVGRSVGCAIYGRRPEVCRSFDAGSDECLSARDAMDRKRARPGSRRRATRRGRCPALCGADELAHPLLIPGAHARARHGRRRTKR